MLICNNELSWRNINKFSPPRFKLCMLGYFSQKYIKYLKICDIFDKKIWKYYWMADHWQPAFFLKKIVEMGITFYKTRSVGHCTCTIFLSRCPPICIVLNGRLSKQPPVDYRSMQVHGAEQNSSVSVVEKVVVKGVWRQAVDGMKMVSSPSLVPLLNVHSSSVRLLH